MSASQFVAPGLPPGIRPPLSVRIFDVTCSLGLLVISAPALAASSILVGLVDGKPLFYRGVRLGLGGKEFQILKIRTLKPEAQKRLGSSLVCESRPMTTRTGIFLRDTRLDELPQILLVLKGEMGLFGPRPDRPEVFNLHVATIPGYERRLAVAPGLFGRSQILTPHGAPKRVRAVLDRRYTDGRRSALEDLGLIVLTGWAVTGLMLRRVASFARTTYHSRVSPRVTQRRSMRRSPARHISGEIVGRENKIDVLDINSSALRYQSRVSGKCEMDDLLWLRIPDPGGRGVRRAQVKVTEVLRSSDGESVVEYESVSDNSRYMLDQYVLRRSIARLPSFLRGRRGAGIGRRFGECL